MGVAFAFAAPGLDLRLRGSPLALAVVLAALVVKLGHVLASVLVGHRVFEVRIGAGPAVRIPVGSTSLVLGLLPVGGQW